MSTQLTFGEAQAIKKVAVFVAHPDDETIWMGGTLLTYKKWHWNVFVMCDCDGRIDRLRNVAVPHYNGLGVGNLNVQCFDLLNSDDRDVAAGQRQDLIKRLSSIDISGYDLLFTHNEIGEYQHPQHELIHEVLIGLYPKKETWQFICPGAKNFPQPRKSKEISVSLDTKTLAAKEEIFRETYPNEQYLWTNLNDIMVYEMKTGPEIFASL